MIKKSRQELLKKCELITVDKNTLNFQFDENKKFYEILFGEGNEKIVERIISDLDKIFDYEIIEDPNIFNYLKEKKIVGFERLVCLEKPKIEEITNVNNGNNDNNNDPKKAFDNAHPKKNEEKVEEKAEEKPEEKAEEKPEEKKDEEKTEEKKEE